MRGHTRAGLTNRTLRFWTLQSYPNCTVVLLAWQEPLQIVAVLHGKGTSRACAA
jgi:hypothetical protein